MKEWWEVLEVNENVTEEEVKAAYRRLAKKYHPDLCKSKSEEDQKIATEKMTEINNAFEEYKNKDNSDNINDTNATNNAGYYSGDFNAEKYYSGFNAGKYYDEPVYDGFEYFHEKGREGFTYHGHYYEHNSKNRNAYRKRKARHERKYRKEQEKKYREERYFYDEDFDWFYNKNKNQPKKVSMLEKLNNIINSLKKLTQENVNLLKQKIIKVVTLIKHKQKSYKTSYNYGFSFGTDNDNTKYDSLDEFFKARRKIVNKVCRKYNFSILNYNEIYDLCENNLKKINDLKLKLEKYAENRQIRNKINECIEKIKIHLCVLIKVTYPKLSNEECIIIVEDLCNVNCTESHFCDITYHDEINNAFTYKNSN